MFCGFSDTLLLVIARFCRLCQTERRKEDFSWKDKKNAVRHSYCRFCQNERSKAHYSLNKARYLEKSKRRNQKVLKEIREYVWNFLSTHPCIDCGESDIIVLEFDHISDKINSISGILKDKSSLLKLKTEIDKCVVRCANCHRRKTAKDFEWKKAVFAPLAQQIEHLSSEQRVGGASPSRGTKKDKM